MFENNFAKFLAENNVKEIQITEGLNCDDGCCYEPPNLKVVFNSGFSTELTNEKLEDLLK